MSSSLVWQLVKDHNSFVVKRERTGRSGAVQFSSEPGNLLNVNTFKYSGLANNAVVHVGADLTLVTKAGKVANKPKTAAQSESLTLHAGKSSKKVEAAVKAVRPDLTRAAQLRFKKVARAASVKKGYSKKVVKSTRRN